MKYKKKKRRLLLTTLFILILSIGVGYAYLSSNLSIRGNMGIAKATWVVRFENIVIQNDSNDTSFPTINNTEDAVSFTVTLAQPKDLYHFTMDIKNAGTIDAMINTFTNTTLSANQQKYLEYKIMYKNGANIKQYDLLKASSSQTIDVFLKYKDNIPKEVYTNVIEEELTLTFTIDYVQADNYAKQVLVPFSIDSWTTIINNVKAGKIENYPVGSTKEVTMGELGTHTVRVANTSAPAECLREGFSQTACGFVLEFVDIITTHNMNSAQTNVGGWPASEMRAYIQNTIYSSLPVELRNGISNTSVISGHGSTDTTNFISIDKLYLLSTKEVWGKEGTSNVVDNDSVEETRQLDYYNSIGVTTSNTNGVIKKNGSSILWWWLRSTYSEYADSFYSVSHTGVWYDGYSYSNAGVSLAFRIG